MTIHAERFEGAGRTFEIDIKGIDGMYIRVEDWWDRVYGQSWMDADGNAAAMTYAIRTGLSRPDIPTDNEVVYGKVDSIGHLVHVSELGEVAR